MRYESADAVYARVSVPCAITKPIKHIVFFVYERRKPMFRHYIRAVKRKELFCFYVDIFETSGTSRSNSEAPRRNSAPFVGREAIVPPVPINSILFSCVFTSSTY